MFYSVDFVRLEIIMRIYRACFMFNFSWSALCTNVVIAVFNDCSCKWIMTSQQIQSTSTTAANSCNGFPFNSHPMLRTPCKAQAET